MFLMIFSVTLRISFEGHRKNCLLKPETAFKPKEYWSVGVVEQWKKHTRGYAHPYNDFSYHSKIVFARSLSPSH